MNLGLDGKTALVFGGSKGLGHAMAKALAGEGAQVAFVRDPAGLKAAVAALGGVRQGHAVVADLADIGSALRAVTGAEAALGGRHSRQQYLRPPPGPVSYVDPDVWRGQFEAMILSVFKITDKVLPGMRRTNLTGTDHNGTLNPATALESEDKPFLRLRGICKRFGGLHALRDVDLDVRSGEVLALLGDNGAGKTTLVKTISGVLQPSGGSMHCRGEEVKIANPDKAHQLGIETVFQDLALVPNLPVADNFSSAVSRPSTSCLGSFASCASEPWRETLPRR